jgi:hypothetical protein
MPKKKKKKKAKKKKMKVLISGFRRDVDETCPLLGYYATSCDNCLPTFRDNLSVPSSRVKSPSRKDSDCLPVKMGPTRCPATSVNNYHMTSRNIPLERRSQEEGLFIGSGNSCIYIYEPAP